MENQALTGLKVVGFVTAGVGPLILRSLATNGATCVHIESYNNPDITRTVSPFKDGQPGMDRAYCYTHTHPDNYSLLLNIKHSRAKEVTRRLVSWADVIIDNFRPGVMQSWNLGYEDLKAINPEIIVLSSSQQGQTGSRRMIAAAGPHLSGLSGFVHLAGWPDRAPVALGAYPDFVAPPFGVAALLAALDYRRRTGKGQYIDLSQYETSAIFLAPAILDYTVNGKVDIRDGNKSPCAAPHGVYRCKGDDKWCAIAVFNGSEWKAFCKVIGNPAWTKEKRFTTLPGRKKHEDELNQLIEKWTVERVDEEVMMMMQKAGVQAGRVRDMGDLVENCPQTKHRHYLSKLKHPVMGETLLAGNSYILSKTPYRFNRSAPCFGESNEYVCTKFLGMSDEEFVKLTQGGVFS